MSALTVDLTAARGCKFTTFPDGQPHCQIDESAFATTAYDSAELHTRLTSASEVVNACLAVDATRSLLQSLGKSVPIHLNIGYMLGARMDRPIAPGQPATLHVLAALLNVAGASKVRVLDAHSETTLAVLNHAEPLHPDLFIQEALALFEQTHQAPPVVVIPDKGAIARTNAILTRIGAQHQTATCSKVRNSNTGKLSGFALESGSVAGRRCLIVDDICDGGGTFSGVAKVLLEAGAVGVELAVTHGIFSKGLRIEHIDCLYSTDSYRLPQPGANVVQQASRVQENRISYQDATSGHTLAHVWTDILSRVVSART